MYDYERGTVSGKICPSSSSFCTDTVIRTTDWIGKIALMYPSDYGYSTSGGNITNKDTCLNTSLYSWSSSSVSDCRDNSWLYINADQWTITPHAYQYTSSYVFYIDNQGKIINNNHTWNDRGIRPTVFLKSSVIIDSGEGTSASPYKLVM